LPELAETETAAQVPESGQDAKPAEAQAELPWSIAAEAAAPDAPVSDAPESAEPLADAPVAEAPAPAEAAAPEPQHEPQPVPANDVISGPVIQPIVIGSESTPLERKRGWWRRR